MAKVYVSSTVVDLKAERQVVIDWLVQARHQPVHSYLPDSETVRDSCLADIDSCDLYVLILGHRYGFIPETDNPEGLSITHLEFRRATLERHLPCVALLRTSVPDIKLSDLLDDKLRPKVQAFRAEITSRAGEFSNTAELVACLSAGVTNELAKLAARSPAVAASNRVVPKPVLRLPLHPIIGREDQVKVLLDGLDAGKRDFAFEYLAGVGKTTVASELVRSDAVMKRFPDGVLWAHLGKDPVVRRQLEKWAKALKLPDDDIRSSNGVVELSATVAAAIADRRMLLVIDDVWTSEAGQYFLIGGPQCARVLTTRYRNIARELIPAGGVVSEVRKLTPANGFRLLCEVAPEAAKLAPEALRQLVTRVDGLPIALVLIGNMLRKKGANPSAIRMALQSLTDFDDVFGMKKPPEFAEEPDESGQFRNLSLGEVIQASYDALGTGGDLNRYGLDGDALRDALKSLSVLRPDPAWFDTGLAQLVTEAPVQVLFDLADAGMIEAVHYDVNDNAGAGEDRYTMHRVIAEYVRKKLSPDEARALNRRAADHYFEKLRKLEESHQARGAASYSAMYRYEDPEWTDCQDNWLYYLAQSGNDAEANLAFLHAWFDGFWWWNCFTAEGFDFCDQLLGEWDDRLELTLNDPSRDAPLSGIRGDRVVRLRRGLDLLRQFKRAYPKETESRSSGSWPVVVVTLAEVRRLAALDGDPSQLPNTDARHVRGLTDIFLAEDRRFGNNDCSGAETYYREALSLFRQDHDDWNTAWTLYHLADMLCSYQRHEDARPLCLDSLPLGHAESDPEVIANLHRVLGDIEVSAGNIAEAMHNYELAVEHAYRFQVEPQPPDEYTVQFYADVTQQVASRLLRSDPARVAEVKTIVRSLRKTWADRGAELAGLSSDDALLDTQSVDVLAARVFPPALPLERLAVDGPAYADGVRKLIAAQRVAGAPGG